ncbi:CHAT domain-containing protein [Streptomyces sp. NPDC050988]|uniref:CHAT domain-containing protein n=1 Tax=Streptomyces sp. NPDC050988 TaxID=3365637 RepID=UPI00378D498D
MSEQHRPRGDEQDRADNEHHRNRTSQRGRNPGPGQPSLPLASEAGETDLRLPERDRREGGHRLAGFRHVIATRWNVPDRAASTIADAFYKSLARQAIPPAAGIPTALHHAVRQMRDAEAHLPSRWAAHYHTGP